MQISKQYICCLKAVASVVIVLYHYRHLMIYEKWPDNTWMSPDGNLQIIYRYGYLVVELFFLLSGFMLTKKYLTKEQKKESFFDFFGRKFVRLFPEFILTMFVCIVIQYATLDLTGSFSLGLTGLTLNDVLFSLTGIQCGIFTTRVPFNVPAWFITPLIVCYCLFWLIFYSEGDRRESDKKFLLAVSAMLLGGCILMSGWKAAIFNERLGRGLFAFFFGVLLGRICGIRRYRFLLTVMLFSSLLMVKAGMGGNLLISSPFIFLC